MRQQRGDTKLPPKDNLARLEGLDWEDIVRRYREAKQNGTLGDFVTAEFADAICALFFVHEYSAKEVSDVFGETRPICQSSMMAYAFLTPEVRLFTDPDLQPERMCLGVEDVLLVSAYPSDKQLRIAQNILSMRRKKLARSTRPDLWRSAGRLRIREPK